MSSQDKVFPILDRRAPLIERVRNDRNLPVGRRIATKLNDFIREEDEELKIEEIERIQSDFRSALADELGVDGSNINDSVVDEVTEIFTLTEEDIIIEPDEEDSENEDLNLFGEN